MNLILVPTDWLLRRLDYLDSQFVSRSHGGKRGEQTEPLLFTLLSPHKSPLTVALQHFGGFCTGGDLSILLEEFWHRVARSPQWWDYWALRAVCTLAHQAANILQRLALPLREFPLKLFSIPAVVHACGGDRNSATALRVAGEILGDDCVDCRDKGLSAKVLRRAVDARSFLQSAEFECLVSGAADLALLNLDLERLQDRRGSQSNRACLGVWDGGSSNTTLWGVVRHRFPHRCNTE